MSSFNGASFTGAVFNLSTTIVGAGIMVLPATMKVIGLVPGLVMIVLVALLQHLYRAVLRIGSFHLIITLIS
jgi:amino acid permease